MKVSPWFCIPSSHVTMEKQNFGHKNACIYSIYTILVFTSISNCSNNEKTNRPWTWHTLQVLWHFSRISGKEAHTVSVTPPQSTLSSHLQDLHVTAQFSCKRGKFLHIPGLISVQSSFSSQIKEEGLSEIRILRYV